MTTLIDTILERIAANNRVGFDGYHQGNLDGRVEAYEDVLRIVGYYDEHGEPKERRP